MFLGPEDVQLREIELPPLGPGEVRARVDVALTCGADRKMCLRGHPLFEPPFIFGHEFLERYLQRKLARRSGEADGFVTPAVGLGSSF